MKIETIQREMEEAFGKIQKVSGKDVVLIIGVTGAGKSTTVNYLLEHRLKKYRDKVVFADGSEPRAEDSKPRAEIGLGKDAMTFYPGVYTSKEGVVYCDCPGFRDTREEEKKLCVSLSREAVVKEAKSIQSVIAVVDWHSIQSERGKGLKDVALIIGNIFSEEKADSNPKQVPFNIKESLLFVITKTRPDEVDMDYFMEEITGTLAVQKQRLEEAKSKKKERVGRKKSILKELTFSNLKKEKEEVDIKKEKPTEDKSQEEVISNLEKTIDILTLMQNEKNVILIDVCDTGQTRKMIEKRLKGMRPVPKTLINFGASDSEVVNLRRQFSWKVMDEMGKAIRVLNDINQLSEEIKKANNEVVELVECVKNYKNEIQDMESQPGYELKQNEQEDPFVLTNKEKIKKNEAEIAAEQKKIRQLTNKLEEDKYTLSTLDTSEGTLFHEEYYKEGRGGFLAKSMVTPGLATGSALAPEKDDGGLFDSLQGGFAIGMGLIVTAAVLPFSSLFGGMKKFIHKFEYQGAPFLVVQETSKHGELKRLTYEPGSGKYIARYKSERGRTGIASIQIIGEKRNKPDIKSKIDELKDEIKDLRRQVGETETQIKAVGETNKKLEIAGKEFIREKRKLAIEDLIEDTNHRLRDLREKISEKESRLIQLEKIHDEKNVFWHLLVKVHKMNLIKLDPSIYPTYPTTASKFQGLLGSSRLSLPKQELEGSSLIQESQVDDDDKLTKLKPPPSSANRSILYKEGSPLTPHRATISTGDTTLSMPSKLPLPTVASSETTGIVKSMYTSGSPIISKLPLRSPLTGTGISDQDQNQYPEVGR